MLLLWIIQSYLKKCGYMHNLHLCLNLSHVFSSVAQPEVQTLSTVTVSESSSSSVRVSWAPLLPHLIQAYQVEYSALPSGPLRVISVNNRQDSIVLTDLQPDTQYLVTISARQSSGKERAMSVKACTQEGKDEQMCYAFHYKCTFLFQ